MASRSTSWPVPPGLAMATCCAVRNRKGNLRTGTFSREVDRRFVELTTRNLITFVRASSRRWLAARDCLGCLERRSGVHFIDTDCIDRTSHASNASWVSCSPCDQSSIKSAPGYQKTRLFAKSCEYFIQSIEKVVQCTLQRAFQLLDRRQ
jgi:hypothetical protein